MENTINNPINIYNNADIDKNLMLKQNTKKLSLIHI